MRMLKCFCLEIGRDGGPATPDDMGLEFGVIGTMADFDTLDDGIGGAFTEENDAELAEMYHAR